MRQPITTIILGFALSLALLACTAQPATLTPTVSPPATASATAKPTLAPTATPTLAPTLTPAPTATLAVAPTALMVVYSGGVDGVDVPDSCVLWVEEKQFVLEADGTLIVFTPEAGLLTKKLAPAEVADLLAQVAQTGFWEIPAWDNPQDPNPVYLPTAPNLGEGGASTTITIQDKRIVYSGVMREYLTEPAQKIVSLIEHYRPADLQRYVPETLWLWVDEVTDAAALPYIVKPDPQAITPWPNTVPALAELGQSLPTFKGTAVVPFLAVFPQLPGAALFSENGQTYYVAACPTLP